MSGDRTSTKSTLKEWVVTRLDKGKAGIECPNCKGKAVVSLRKWRSSQDSIGRSCTYCFKVARIPGR